jgi:hypothetical protein
MSCTTVPALTEVTTLLLESRISVRAVSSAQNFDAGPELESVEFVSRCRSTPPTSTSVVALIVVVPDDNELMTTVQEPVPPEVVQLLEPTNAAVAPPEFVNEKLIVVPLGAFSKPEPLFTFTCPVNAWFVPTALLADGGAIWMLASPATLKGSHAPSEPR